jgi:hypothetical protein
MEFNPYAPPKASVADREPDTHGLKYCSLWLMIVFLFISFGLPGRRSHQRLLEYRGQFESCDVRQ